MLHLQTATNKSYSLHLENLYVNTLHVLKARVGNVEETSKSKLDFESIHSVRMK